MVNIIVVISQDNMLKLIYYDNAILVTISYNNMIPLISVNNYMILSSSMIILYY